MKILDMVFVYRLAHGENLSFHGRYHAHGENEYEVHFFLEGEGSFLSNTARLSINDNSLFLAGPHEFHSIMPDKVAKPITYYAVLFSLDEESDPEIYNILTSILKSRAIKRQGSTANRFLIEELLRLSTSHEEGLEKSALYLLYSLLYRWFSGSISSITPAVAMQEKKNTQALVQNALSYFAAHLKEQISISSVAYRLGLSAEHFIRVFREEMHMTPYQYFMRLRAEAAAQDLISSKKSIAEIAEEYAFENQFHFSKLFKHCTGFTPSAYRRYYARAN
ncbi:MAG: AraC family transcriptional regulator [Treponemataceae bacterium]|nr:AraC family transcriptional regulator [Treponemataceae bacterium]